MNVRISRRTFTVATSSLFAVPMIIPSRAFGANERIITGHIGVGGQGKGNLSQFAENAVAICDVDSKRAAEAAKKIEEKGRKPEIFIDYRKMLERKDIDAVVISTPDHWHALGTIHACQAGKDVYVEKPLSLTILEGRKMVEAARANKRIVQTGSQQRSDKNFRRACELVRIGAIGKVQTVLVGIPGPNYPKDQVADSDPPAELDYDMWLGPAPLRPYNKMKCHYNFRFYWDYSGGQMTNWGAHHIDIAQWGLGRDASGPISSEGTAGFNEKKIHEVTESCRITHTYADGVKLIVGQGEKDIPGGTTFIGEKGQIFVTRGKLTADPASILETPAKDGDVKLITSPGHHKNFLECIKTRELPICDVEIGHRTATVCHLGNIVARLGRKVQWDPEKEAFVNDAEAQALVSRPYRAPWTLG